MNARGEMTYRRELPYASINGYPSLGSDKVVQVFVRGGGGVVDVSMHMTPAQAREFAAALVEAAVAAEAPVEPAEEVQS